MNKFDWARINDKALMQRRGTETVNRKKPLEIIGKVTCSYCRTQLKDNTPKSERDHLAKCGAYHEAVDSGRVKKPIDLKEKKYECYPLSHYFGEQNFPFCTLGKIIRLKNFTGKVKNISGDAKKITLIDDVGKEKTYLIDFLLKP